MNTDHIIINVPEGEARCLHCADYHSLSVVPAKRFLAIVRGFLIMHEQCPRPVEPSRQVDLFDAQARANPEPSGKCGLCGKTEQLRFYETGLMMVCGP